ncbi:5-oxoprolinase subunit PxpA [Thioclava sp. A2]|uniref:LamB/YcsF family protein n=1 Tax=Thioclava sp. FCG-A2 TaxID=3080562 RepID=UPI0029540EDA|nr:5-oxoprolinase subunit PxpA [Thioclava sp. A2]MDV7269859.1 5-oxoprolinase subunit PxpA [Thioclava sp. A2]
MARRVDLNADLGEGCGQDAALIQILTSANICCGLHAGSPAEMAHTMRLARDAGLGIGAHPGYDDRANFGRTRCQLAADDLRDLIRYQVGAAKSVAAGFGVTLEHLKLHGAMANMAAEDAEMAEICYRAALEVEPAMRLMTIAATAQQEAAEAIGARWIGEIFADRAYRDDARLVDRSEDGAVLHDPQEAAERLVTMITEGAIVARSGKRIAARIESICLHGDTPEALEMAREIRSRLSTAGIDLMKPD